VGDTVYDRFPKGQRVRPSAEGLERFQRLQGERGVVVGYGREGHTIYIRREGQHTATCWGAAFWEPDGVDDAACDGGW
jgi:hypothetical protein